MKFPLFKTKIEGADRKFDLISPQGQRDYFEFKAGREIKKLREYLTENSFIAYLLGKKNSGKGTYAKMFAEVVSPERIDHFSVGDMVRAVDVELQESEKKKKLVEFLGENYRGYLPLEQILQALGERSTKALLPTELILALVKREISQREKKAIFIDGFPRDLDQVSYSLFFRDLIGYRDDPDVFVLIDVPKAVIDERIKWRRVCPKCQTSRNLTLLPTSQVEYDELEQEFYLICDNPVCQGARMVAKEGDEFGIEPIKERLASDEKLMEKAISLQGVRQIFLRNSVLVEEARQYVDDYEITPQYGYEWDEKTKKVRTIEKPWLVKDDEGGPSYSLLAPPVLVSLIKQMVGVLNLSH